MPLWLVALAAAALGGASGFLICEGAYHVTGSLLLEALIGLPLSVLNAVGVGLMLGRLARAIR